MTAYKIIGGDQKEYGPVTAEQLRQWVAEGRANAQTLIKAEGGADWKPLCSFAEFVDLFGTTPATLAPLPPGEAPPPPPLETVLSRDYDLDIGNCVSRSWTLITQNFWPVVGVSFLVWFIQIAVGQVFSLFTRSMTNDLVRQIMQEHRLAVRPLLITCAFWLVTMPINTLLFAGLYKYYLKLIRGQRPEIGDAFSGFGPMAGQLLLVGFVMGFLTLLGVALCILPGLYLSVAWIFSIPLIIDRQMNFWEAMEFSRKVATRHWFMVFGLLIVIALVTLAGFIACCIGVFVAAPIAWVALMYAYEDIFSRQTP